MGASFEVERGTPLQDVLFAHGVEFPCGGKARCKGCRVRVLTGNLPATPEMGHVLKPEELKAGWRLSCQGKALEDLTLEFAQWEAKILTDDTQFDFKPREGLGVAVDLGTSTVVAQLLDLSTANVLAVRTGLNTQARHGADIMSRVGFAVAEKGQKKLEDLIRKQIGKLIDELLAAAKVPRHHIRDVTIVGNSVMHHLFCGISIEPLSHYPFEPTNDGLQVFRAGDIGWKLDSGCTVRFLPCLGSFVGSDILAGVLATRLHESEALVGLVDLGTNGEIVIGNREQMLCASTAAGPAFEGARIWMGMRAATGAISEVTIAEGKLQCHVLGNVEPRGICGSGLVDAVACSLELGLIKPTGRLADGGDEMMLAAPVKLSQTDIRELQLAKGAIAAGIRILLEQWGAKLDDLTHLYLAGAFGNYINRTSARKIGLLPFPREKVTPSGNTALLGSKLALFSVDGEDGSYATIRKRIRHVSLSEDPQFQDIYVDEMSFPSPT
jgi:uncharacterized 2Fe-2S/4Fe-4S cluster protein (DUF4445 family)